MQAKRNWKIIRADNNEMVFPLSNNSDNKNLQMTYNKDINRTDNEQTHTTDNEVTNMTDNSHTNRSRTGDKDTDLTDNGTHTTNNKDAYLLASDNVINKNDKLAEGLGLLTHSEEFERTICQGFSTIVGPSLSLTNIVKQFPLPEINFEPIFERVSLLATESQETLSAIPEGALSVTEFKKIDSESSTGRTVVTKVEYLVPKKWKLSKEVFDSDRPYKHNTREQSPPGFRITFTALKQLEEMIKELADKEKKLDKFICSNRAGESSRVQDNREGNRRVLGNY
ncbi:uncharacterized protein FOMMEDRAFT_25083 [Fomitiporia mediterranea MF3/22]|uniref:uncharacterized protein n=1 Tax=Fomitiporia mediterranea (strain MF3/22) TaxID=694068 RepID=UPI0004409955|nr:uncharacterized protein FOMMEDRAFT_25083 [Fomitiporia mediterranea MF3/22]EJD07812.1 hypothetical protein FOMMEDRAFT_25083 [Fomitiporia mediterranea MF3/22]